MGVSYAKQAAFSERAFREVVWPVLGPLCGGGTLRSLEMSGSGLDTHGGVDAYQEWRTGVRTIAQRTQRVDDYDKPSTFTIRLDRQDGGVTEWAKRLEALDRGNDLPSITIQAYVMEASDTLVKAAIVHTRAFYEWARTNRWRLRRKSNRDDGNGFLVVPWSLLATDSDVPLATKDMLVHTRSPRAFFAGWPEDRWI